MGKTAISGHLSQTKTAPEGSGIDYLL